MTGTDAGREMTEVMGLPLGGTDSEWSVPQVRAAFLAALTWGYTTVILSAAEGAQPAKAHA